MKNDLFNLENETAVVLGGTGVLGGAMADALAAAGARVAIVGRSEERGQKRVRAIEAAGGRALFHPADALDHASLMKARDAIIKQWGAVTVLVNGAGGNRPEGTPGVLADRQPVHRTGGSPVSCRRVGELLSALPPVSLLSLES